MYSLARNKSGNWDLAGWQGLGLDVASVEIPLEIRFDEKTLELRVRAAPETPLPAFDLPEVRWPSMAFVSEVIPNDFLGQKRDSGKMQVGPLVNLPLDGTPVRVDPRRLNGNKAP